MNGVDWLNFVGPIVVALIAAVLGGRYAAKRAAQVDNRRVDLDGYSRLNEALQRDVDELRRDRNEDRRRFSSELATVQQRLTAAQRRIDQLERGHEQDGERIRRLAADLLKISDWARGLVALLEHAGIEFPPAPIDLNTANPHLRLPRTQHERPETD